MELEPFSLATMVIKRSFSFTLPARRARSAVQQRDGQGEQQAVVRGGGPILGEVVGHWLRRRLDPRRPAELRGVGISERPEAIPVDVGRPNEPPPREGDFVGLLQGDWELPLVPSRLSGALAMSRTAVDTRHSGSSKRRQRGPEPRLVGPASGLASARRSANSSYARLPGSSPTRRSAKALALRRTGYSSAMPSSSGVAQGACAPRALSADSSHRWTRRPRVRRTARFLFAWRGEEQRETGEGGHAPPGQTPAPPWPSA